MLRIQVSRRWERIMDSKIVKRNVEGWHELVMHFGNKMFLCQRLSIMLLFLLIFDFLLVLDGKNIGLVKRNTWASFLSNRLIVLLLRFLLLRLLSKSLIAVSSGLLLIGLIV